MPSMRRIGKGNTKVVKTWVDDAKDGMLQRLEVTLHETKVVDAVFAVFGGGGKVTVTLNSGGWLTQTTKNRMNQTANEYNLPFNVSQQNGEWSVWLQHGVDFTFFDGMQLDMEVGR